MECLEIILVKAYILHFHYLNKKDEKWLFSQLSSVSFEWLCTIARRRFKNFLHRRFTVYFSRIGKRKEIFRNNKVFLRELIQPNLSFIHQLQTFRCLTSEEVTHINRLSSERDKNHELYKAMRSYDPRWYLSFIECLRLSGQSLIAGVVEQGGATVKFKLSKMPCSDWRNTKQLLVNSLNQLQAKNGPRTHQIEIQLSFLRRFDLEILGATAAKGIDVWFWCHSEIGLKQLQENQFVCDTLTALFQCFPPLLRLLPVVDPTLISSNLRQFARKVVTCPVTVHLRTRLQIPTRQKSSFLGTAQLDDKIYVLSKFPDAHTIKIYQDERRIGEIDIEDIIEPKYLSACHRTKCLYVLDGIYNNKNGCESGTIWKINPTNKKVLLWLDESDLHDVSEYENAREEIISLSVSNKGHLLLLRYDNHKRPILCHLDVYNGETDVTPPQRCFHPITVQIKDPHHAIETAEGHFLVSYGHRNESGLREVTKSGDIVRYFHHFDPRDQSEPLAQPVYLEMGSYGRVLVASSSNSQVVLIDPQLNTYEVLVSAKDHGIDKPTQLSYCRDKKQLLVIHHRGKNIDVYCLNDTTL